MSSGRGDQSKVGARPETNTLLTMIRHRAVIQDNLKGIAQMLERRGDLHDLSKFSDEEFPGFRNINHAARGNKYGSPEYKKALETIGGEGGAFEHHVERNRHHPEHFLNQTEMSFIDIIEMVCDWHAASVVYGNNTLRESLEKHHKRFNLSLEQWWLINQVVKLLEDGE